MKASVILGHPAQGSFNHAIGDTVRAALLANGHEVRYHDLYAENFDPIMTAPELAPDAPLAPEIERHCQELCDAEGIVIIHPNWWSAPPAIMRGWVDRVIRAGRAYHFVPDGKGGAKPVGLLRASVAMIFNTANTPQEKEEQFYGDPLQTHWLKVVFGLCGVKIIYRRNFAPVITSTLEQRQQWLRTVRSAVMQHFPKQGDAQLHLHPGGG